MHTRVIFCATFVGYSISDALGSTATLMALPRAQLGTEQGRHFPMYNIPQNKRGLVEIRRHLSPVLGLRENVNHGTRCSTWPIPVNHTIACMYVHVGSTGSIHC